MSKAIAPLPQKPVGATEEPVEVDSRNIKSIVFFGDSSISEDNPIYGQVRDTAKLLAEKGYKIVDGGGPGVMAAATEGAESVNGQTVAIYWQPKLASIFEGKNLSNVADESQSYSNYMMRTLGLIEKGQVYIVCKGGTGTISELGMVWALAKLYYGKHKPVILFGDFWKDIIEAMQKGMLLDDNELGVLNYATKKEEVLELIEAFEMEVQTRVRKTYEGDETAFVLAPKSDQAYKERMAQTTISHKYRVANYVTKSQLEDFKSLVQPPARVLEVGCGAGYDLSFLSENYSVTAIDNDPEVLEIARFENPNVDIHLADMRTYDVPENTFKGIWMRDSFHHIPDSDTQMVIDRLTKGLVPGGIMYIVAREGEGEIMEKDVIAGRMIDKYVNLFTEEDLRNLGIAAGLETLKVSHVQRSHNWIAAVMRKPV